MTDRTRHYRKQAQPQVVPRRHSFRSRGYHFLKQAGTSRKTLVELMWEHPGHWFKYFRSYIHQKLPCFSIKPRPTTDFYRHVQKVSDPNDFSFILVGDTGMNSPGQYLVTTAISHTERYHSDFCLILGDVMYPSGSESDYRLGLVEAFKHYPRPVLAIPGNHDWYDHLQAFNRYFLKDADPKCKFYGNWCSPGLPNWFYHMDFGDSLRVICLDSGIAGTMEQHRETQLHWLKKLLDESEGKKVLVMIHHPLYSITPQSHQAGLQKVLEPVLNHPNVTAVFSGHDHNYQRHMVEGKPFVIQGAGGSTLKPVAETRDVVTATGKKLHLQKTPDGDSQYSFTHCHWKNGHLVVTTYSAHEVPGKILDRFVI